MAYQWYYMKGSERQGPVSSEQLKQLASSGQLLPSDLVWKEGMANWQPASRLSNVHFGSPPAATVVQESSPEDELVAALGKASTGRRKPIKPVASTMASPSRLKTPCGKKSGGLKVVVVLVIIGVVAGGGYWVYNKTTDNSRGGLSSRSASSSSGSAESPRREITSAKMGWEVARSSVLAILPQPEPRSIIEKAFADFPQSPARENYERAFQAGKLHAEGLLNTSWSQREIRDNTIREMMYNYRRDAQKLLGWLSQMGEMYAKYGGRERIEVILGSIEGYASCVGGSHGFEAALREAQVSINLE